MKECNIKHLRYFNLLISIYSTQKGIFAINYGLYTMIFVNHASLELTSTVCTNLFFNLDGDFSRKPIIVILIVLCKQTHYTTLILIKPLICALPNL